MTSLPLLSNAEARRLFLDRHGLAAAPSGPAKGPALAQLIRDLGFVQVDSVNTLARAHDMILWSRRQAYRPADLERLLDPGRSVFEHWTHDAAVLPLDWFPHWKHRFRRDAEHLGPRYRAWQGSAFEDRFDTVLNRISDHGECTSGELAGTEMPRKGQSGWWDWHPSKTALEYLWRVGAISVKRRDGFRKVYDLTERVIPEAFLKQETEAEQTVDWCCRMALDRLGFATSGEIAAFLDLITPQEAKHWCAGALSRGEIEEIEVESAGGPRRTSFAWPGTVDMARMLPPPSDRVRLLSPFDPALRDRNRAERLFGFHYRIEIFVPEAKRQYGYYVFPVLEGDRLIGRMDVKANRPWRPRSGAANSAQPYGQLSVRAFWPEAGVAMGQGRLARLQSELERVARFAGVDQVDWDDGWLRPRRT